MTQITQNVPPFFKAGRAQRAQSRPPGRVHYLSLVTHAEEPMSSSQLLRQLAELHRAIEALPVPADREVEDFETLETLKHGLDNARLGLWARLQGVDTEDAPAYVRNFRVKRAVEICSRLTTDLRLGLLDPRHGEYTALLTTVLDLAHAIHTGRVRRAEGID